jgi:hypothetical protein
VRPRWKRRGAWASVTTKNGANTMPLCVWLCYTPGCQQKVERWMVTAEEGSAARIECPRCGEPMRCAWTGAQSPTPSSRDKGLPARAAKL